MLGSLYTNAANRLTEDEIFVYTYDANGNLETKTEKIGGLDPGTPCGEVRCQPGGSGPVGGNVIKPSFDHLQEVAETFGIALSWLIGSEKVFGLL